MNLHWRVYIKASVHSPWRFTGIIESDKAKAVYYWAKRIKDLKYFAYKLEWTTSGIPIHRE